jgi:enamine deaminase RidA (YjgF/YER057c/UK114 family)
MSTVTERLEALGLTLPKAAAPVANYVPFVRSGNLVVISGRGVQGMVQGKAWYEASYEAWLKAGRAAHARNSLIGRHVRTVNPVCR